jgi:glyoxylase-like metal-dependent hydrolase (beta-lactamase superfamily II)
MRSMALNIKLLKALQGDCIILSYGLNLETYILIDGGMGTECQRQLQKFVKEIKDLDRKIELLILTHIDSDHIDGILKLFSERGFDFSLIKLMFFNFGKGLNKKLNISEEV